MIDFEVPFGEERVLLHTCCAPCSSAIIECMLHNGVHPTVFYSNSNIFPIEEYDRRKIECARWAELNAVPMVEDEYSHEQWLSHIRGLENEPERGGRCLECFRFRLLRAAEYASANGFKVLTTTLASSRWKSLEQINRAGEWACARVDGVQWWNQNWRKGGLQERRNEIIREQNFYNQLYCGCEFSVR